MDFCSKWMWTKELGNNLYNTTVLIRKYDRSNGGYISLAAFSRNSKIRAINFYKL